MATTDPTPAASLGDLLDQQPALRRLHLEVRQWSLARGRPVDSAGLAVVLLTKADRPEPMEQWSTIDVDEMVWTDLVAFCQRHRLPPPEAANEALWSLLDFLADSGRLSGTSDGRAALRAPLVAVGGLDAAGRRVHGRAAHPSGAAAAGRVADVIPLVS